MNKTYANACPGSAWTLVLATTLALPALASEPVAPAVLGADELSLPAVDASRELRTLPAVQTRGPVLSIGGAAVEAVDLEQLAHERGRADTVINDTKLNGDVANNSAVNVQTGSNTIDAGSFANMSGIPVVIQNSGANVLIQNATVINLQFR